MSDCGNHGECEKAIYESADQDDPRSTRCKESSRVAKLRPEQSAVMIVEDNRSLGEALGRILNRTYADVQVFPDVPDALASMFSTEIPNNLNCRQIVSQWIPQNLQSLKYSPDLMIVDTEMPLGTGGLMYMATCLLPEEYRPAYIACSGNIDSGWASESKMIYEEFNVTFLEKPFIITDLMDWVRAKIRSLPRIRGGKID